MQNQQQQQQQQLTTAASTTTTNINTTTVDNDVLLDELDMYHALVRFLKYGCEKATATFRASILDKRLLVHVSRLLFKLYKNLVETVQQAPPASTIITTSTTSSTTETTTETSTASKPSSSGQSQKITALVNDLVKHYLIFLDSWTPPISNEFYNQVSSLGRFSLFCQTKLN